MHRGAKSHFHCLQIHAADLLSFGKDKVQQAGYFARDLGLDRFARFFSGIGASSTGRARQILSLTWESFATPAYNGGKSRSRARPCVARQV